MAPPTTMNPISLLSHTSNQASFVACILSVTPVHIEKELPLLLLCYYPRFAGKGWMHREVRPFVEGLRSTKPQILGLNLGIRAPASAPLNHSAALPGSELVRL